MVCSLEPWQGSGSHAHFFNVWGFARDGMRFARLSLVMEKKWLLSLDAITTDKLFCARCPPVYANIPLMAPEAVSYPTPLDAVSIGNGLSSGTTPPMYGLMDR